MMKRNSCAARMGSNSWTGLEWWMALGEKFPRLKQNQYTTNVFEVIELEC